MHCGLYDNPGYYDLDEREFLKKETEFVADLVKSEKPNAVCEIGCGTGRILRPLATDVPVLYGIDSNPEMLKVAAQAFSQSLNVHLKPVDVMDKKALQQAIPIPINLVICSYNFLQHFSEPEEWELVIGNCASLLAPHGMLLLDLTIIDNGHQVLGVEREDFHQPYLDGSLRRTQTTTGFNQNRLTIAIRYQRFGREEKLLDTKEFSIAFNKVKWESLISGCLNSGLSVKWIKRGYVDGQLKGKVSILLTKDPAASNRSALHHAFDDLRFNSPQAN